MSLETEQWVAMRKAADALGQQVLAKAYRLLGIAYIVSEHGVQISAYSREHILANSDGAKSVAANLERRGVKRSRATVRDQQRANFEERNHKRMFPLAEFRGMWRARNEERGFPVFEQGDKRLEAGFVLNQVMTPAQAVDAGLALAASRGERVFDERKLLELALKGSGFATPHEGIRDEIGRQLLMQELVLHRGAIVRPAPGQELDAGVSQRPEPRVAPLVALESALALADARSGMSAAERNAVMSLAAGESPRTIVPTTPSGQPAVFAAVASTAAASGRDLMELAPLAHITGPGSALAVETFLERRGALAPRPAVLVLRHADELSERVLADVRARAASFDARLVELHDAGRLSQPLPQHQTNERALLSQAQPFDQVRRDVAQGKGQVVSGPESADAIAVRKASERLAAGDRAVVLTDSPRVAAELNSRIATALGSATGEPVKKVRIRKPKPVDPAGTKLASSYAVGDTVLIKRATGTLRRRELATVDAVNVRAGFLTLRVGDGAQTRSVVMSLDTQAHHIERVELTDAVATPGSVMRVNEDMPSLGLESGQAVQVEHVDSESKLIRLRGVSGSEHEVSFNSPAPLSPAMAMTASELSDADLAGLRLAKPEVLVALTEDAQPKDVATVLGLASSLDLQATVYAPQALMDRHPPEPVKELERSVVPGVSGVRLLVRESDLDGLSALQSRLADPQGSKTLESARVTLVLKNGGRRLFVLRNREAMQSLHAELGGVIGPARAPQARAQAVQREELPARPANKDRSR
jgi:hypothetical protein